MSWFTVYMIAIALGAWAAFHAAGSYVDAQTAVIALEVFS